MASGGPPSPQSNRCASNTEAWKESDRAFEAAEGAMRAEEESAAMGGNATRVYMIASNMAQHATAGLPDHQKNILNHHVNNVSVASAQTGAALSVVVTQTEIAVAASVEAKEAAENQCISPEQAFAAAREAADRAEAALALAQQAQATVATHSQTAEQEAAFATRASRILPRYGCN